MASDSEKSPFDHVEQIGKCVALLLTQAWSMLVLLQSTKNASEFKLGSFGGKLFKLL